METSLYPRNYPRRNDGNVFLYALVSFYTTDVSILSAAILYCPAFVCFSSRQAVQYFAVYLVLESFSKLQWQRQRVQWLCKRAL